MDLLRIILAFAINLVELPFYKAHALEINLHFYVFIGVCIDYSHLSLILVERPDLTKSI